MQVWCQFGGDNWIRCFQCLSTIRARDSIGRQKHERHICFTRSGTCWVEDDPTSSSWFYIQMANPKTWSIVRTWYIKQKTTRTPKGDQSTTTQLDMFHCLFELGPRYWLCHFCLCSKAWRHRGNKCGTFPQRWFFTIAIGLGGTGLDEKVYGCWTNEVKVIPTDAENKSINSRKSSVSTGSTEHAYPYIDS